MDGKEFREYVLEHRRIGLDDSQIARKLGMDVGIFKDAVDYAFLTIKDEPVFKEVKPAAAAFEKEEEKPKTTRPPRKKTEVFEVPQGE